MKIAKSTGQNRSMYIVKLYIKVVRTMDKEDFKKRLTELRINKGASARDMSLSIGQSAGYINNIENGVNLPSMANFFYICEYFDIEPKDFFDTESTNPAKINELLEIVKSLNNEQLNILIELAKNLKHN